MTVIILIAVFCYCYGFVLNVQTFNITYQLFFISVSMPSSPNSYIYIYIIELYIPIVYIFGIFSSTKDRWPPTTAQSKVMTRRLHQWLAHNLTSMEHKHERLRHIKYALFIWPGRVSRRQRRFICRTVYSRLRFPINHRMNSQRIIYKSLTLFRYFFSPVSSFSSSSSRRELARNQRPCVDVIQWWTSHLSVCVVSSQSSTRVRLGLVSDHLYVYSTFVC